MFTEPIRTWRCDRNHKTVSLTMRNVGPEPWFWTWTRSKAINGQRITLKKHVILMSCPVQPAVQSCGTGQRIAFWQRSTDHNMDVHYQVLCLKTDCISLGCPVITTNSQLERAYYCSHVIRLWMNNLTLQLIHNTDNKASHLTWSASSNE